MGRNTVEWIGATVGWGILAAGLDLPWLAAFGGGVLVAALIGAIQRSRP